MRGNSVNRGSRGLPTDRSGAIEDSVGKLDNSGDPPGMVALRNSRANWTTKAPNRQVEGKDSGHVRGRQRGIPRK